MLREYAVVKYKLGLAEEQFCQPIPQKMLMELREHTEKVIKNMKAEKT
jgi:predicted nucleic acid-binding protein